MGSKVTSRAALPLAEDAEVAREPVREREAGLLVAGDGEADGDGRRGVGGAVHAAAEELAEHAAHDGERAGAADDVDAGELGQRVVVPAARGGPSPGPSPRWCAAPAARRRRSSRRRATVTSGAGARSPRHDSRSIDDAARVRVEPLLGLAALVGEQRERAPGEAARCSILGASRGRGSASTASKSSPPSWLDPGGGDGLVASCRSCGPARRRRCRRPGRRRRCARAAR